MNCLHPVKLKVNGEVISAPCNHCINCAVNKQSYLAYVVGAERTSLALRGIGSSYITLTYNDWSLPLSDDGKYATLRKDDLQRFFKRLRKRFDEDFPGQRFKYLACGEYGNPNSPLPRPHYHMVLLGMDTQIFEKYAPDVWSNGFCKILPCLAGAVRYISKYATKQLYGDAARREYDDKGIERPFIVRSTHIGDEIILDNIQKHGVYYYSKGKKKLLPAPLRKKYGLKLGTEQLDWNVSQARKAGFKSVSEYALSEANRQASEIVVNARLNQTPIDDCDVRAAVFASGVNRSRVDGLAAAASAAEKKKEVQK